MNLPRIDRDELIAAYNPETGFVWVTYSGSMTAKMTVDVYAWMIELGDYIEVSDVRGAAYDFRQITDFSRYSLSTVQRESRNLNLSLDMSHIPVALIVENEIQKRMIEIGLKLTPQEHRKRIVFSDEEALAFFEEWQEK